MKTIAVLGAGRVARPCIQHLLKEPDFHLLVMDCDAARVERTVGGHPRVQISVSDAREAASDVIHEADIVVSLLPAPLQPRIAQMCVEARKPMLSTSYVSEEIRRLHGEACRSGVLILNEMGVDPGVDHMLAKRVMDRVHAGEGRVRGFFSWCGALPAPEANTNPFGYKVSWSPSDLVDASVRPARYLKDGREVQVPGRRLLETYELKHVEGLGWFEAYPNGDSLKYVDIYGIPEADHVYRGTLRYMGWCETLAKLIDLGLLAEEKKNLQGLTYRELTRSLIGCEEEHDIEEALADRLGIPGYSAVMKRIQWLGLLDREAIPRRQGSPREVLCDLFLKNLAFVERERDLVVMVHEFLVDYPDGSAKRIVSGLIEYGVPDGDTAIARTTGLPVAIGCKMVAREKVDLVGVHIPVHKAIYEVVLEEMERLGVTFFEHEVPHMMRGGAL